MSSEMTFSFVMTEHPSWMEARAGRVRLVAAPGGRLWLAHVAGGRLRLRALLEGGGCEPRWDVFELERSLQAKVADLAGALQGLGSVVRLRNGDLWDALGTAILRQVIRAKQSKRLYRAFCAAHGVRVVLPEGETLHLFPSWETVLTLSDEEFASLGLAFKRRPLRAAARAFGENGARWEELAAGALLLELQDVPGIGAWTAGAAVADWSNDWQLYPYSDLAVRTWARRAAPRYPWPEDEAGFGDLWRSLAGSDLATLTVLTLAWGSQHGDIG